MTCNNCRWKSERNECPWDFMYEETEYAEDCIDFRNTDSEKDAFIEPIDITEDQKQNDSAIL